MNFRQRTLKNKVSCTGTGLHTGKKINLTINPAHVNSGIKFIRTDLPGKPIIEAKPENVTATTLATTIGKNGIKISTIEHLMAAFFGLGIDNATVEVDGSEVPIMDGSSAPFVLLLKSAGIKHQKALKRFIIIKKPFKINDGDKSIEIRPAKELKISYAIDFDHPLLRKQKYEMSFSGGEFDREISRSRTFGFLKEVQMLKENGFAKGGSLENAIVIDDFKILNEDGLRFEDEFVRHKILDFLGDVFIIGVPVIGHFIVKKSGHFLNQNMVSKLMASKRHWEERMFNTLGECARDEVNIPNFGILDPFPA